MSSILFGRRQTNAMSTPPSHAIAKRPRQRDDRDCVVAVFREVTGEDEPTARSRFGQCRSGTQGFTMSDLSACFTRSGWMMVADGSQIPVLEPAFSTFWRGFTGQGILAYRAKGSGVGHVVVARSGGVILDPAPKAPEEGEFIRDHFAQYRDLGQIDFSLSTVFRP